MSSCFDETRIPDGYFPIKQFDSFDKLLTQNMTAGSCAEGCKKCQSASATNCTECFTGYSYNIRTYTCVKCHPFCKTCTKSSVDSCQSCNNGYFLDGSTCTKKIKAGTWGDLKTNTLKPCKAPCATCSGSESHCTSCTANFQLKGNQCVDCIEPCVIEPFTAKLRRTRTREKN